MQIILNEKGTFKKPTVVVAVFNEKKEANI